MGIRLATGGRTSGTALWSVLAASATGTSHRAKNTACQDAHHLALGDDETVVAAAADGAGSARLGGDGAAIASDWAAELLAFHLAESKPRHVSDWEQLLIGVLTRTRARLRHAAGVRNAPLHDLATTLILVAVTPDVVGVAQVGDGTAVLRRTEGGLEVVAEVERAEYLNETVFLTSRGWRDDARTAVIDAADIDAVALLTDGLQLVALDLATGAPHAPFFEPLFAFARDGANDPDELETFLGSERISARTDDDKTLVIAVRRRPERPGAERRERGA